MSRRASASPGLHTTRLGPVSVRVRPPHDPTPGYAVSQRLGEAFALHEIDHPNPDVVADLADALDGLALRILERPVFAT